MAIIFQKQTIMGRAMAGNAFGSILLLAMLSAAVVPTGASWQVPAIFVFGDSTVDVGNNNYLTREDGEKANFKPYGIDYPNSLPTGRFSNGYNIIDYIAKHLGFQEGPPAFLAQHKEANRQNFGANFASAGSGVLFSTGSALNMGKQIRYFNARKTKIEMEVGKDAAKSTIEKSLFVISTGSNDVFKFYQEKAADPNNPSYETKPFIDKVASFYKHHVLRIYRLGARKFVIFNVGMIGCYPFSRSLHPQGECIDDLNQLAQSINNAIAADMGMLNSTLDGMKYSIGSTYNRMSNIIASPPQGFEVKLGCCGDKNFNAGKMCSPDTAFCENRSQYLFWDMLHLSQQAAMMAANSFFSGPNQDFISPTNIQKLVKI